MLPALPGMILALVGGLRLLRQPSPASRLILIWIAITAVGMVLAVPLGWQRYYLPWTLIVILLAGLGMDVIVSVTPTNLPHTWRSLGGGSAES